MTIVVQLFVMTTPHKSSSSASTYVDNYWVHSGDNEMNEFIVSVSLQHYRIPSQWWYCTVFHSIWTLWTNLYLVCKLLHFDCRKAVNAIEMQGIAIFLMYFCRKRHYVVNAAFLVIPGMLQGSGLGQIFFWKIQRSSY